MKWGVRRFQDKNGRLTKAGKERYNDDADPKQKGLTDKQKRYIQIGATIAVTGLAAYGTYRLVKSGKMDELISKGKDFIEKKGLSSTDDVLSSGIPKAFQNVNFNMKTNVTNSLLDADICSRERDEIIKNCSNSAIPGAWDNNCGHASVAWVFRRLGFDVKPEPLNALNGEEFLNRGTTINDIFDIFDTKSKMPDFKSYFGNGVVGRLSKDIKNSCGDVPGSFGIICGTGNGTGHFFTWENVKGNIVFHNPQASNGIHGITTQEMKSLINNTKWGWTNYRAIRVDDAVLNSNYRGLGDPNFVYERLASIMSNV